MDGLLCVTHQEADSAGIWLPGVMGGLGVSEAKGSLCDQPASRIRSRCESGVAFPWGAARRVWGSAV